MITKDKIDTYNYYGGDIDGFLKFVNNERRSINDTEWNKINSFIQDIQLITDKKTSEEYTEKVLSEINKSCDVEVFAYFMKKIPFHEYFMALVGVTKLIEAKINEDTIVGFSEITDPLKLKFELSSDIQKLEKLSFKTLEKLKIQFLPTSTFQELAIANKWSNDYIELSSSFDALYKAANWNSTEKEQSNSGLWTKFKNIFK
ncbi:hypothetical protein DNU06_15795 [Putridiphycobacter roseus]|uniref:Uncharacterized protein n=1 Tax=Putridiphycobacter roseus TaxID=2219161 RepID=A0A2W1NJQ0_9FLAO|nr:hypothetical protein [Putridiphycobacter roseus]PZE15842.1 hypothetical protein DNU06_15795 [Putridiphycobacter roseus]